MERIRGRRARGDRAPTLCAAVLVCGMLTSCAPSATEPGIAADTAGPLTRQQAELLVEAPLADLAASLSDDVSEHADFSADGEAEVRDEDGRCVYVSTVYHSTRSVDAAGWGDLARAVEPQMDAWEMDTSALDDEHRPSGAGLRGGNPHNGAELSLQTWNDHLPEDLDGPTEGLEMSVEVPLAETECAAAG